MDAIRGSLVTFTGDPFVDGLPACRRYERDAVVLMDAGRIVDAGPAADVLPRLPAGTVVTQYANALITAGFIATRLDNDEESVSPTSDRYMSSRLSHQIIELLLVSRKNCLAGSSQRRV